MSAQTSVATGGAGSSRRLQPTLSQVSVQGSARQGRQCNPSGLAAFTDQFQPVACRRGEIVGVGGFGGLQLEQRPAQPCAIPTLRLVSTISTGRAMGTLENCRPQGRNAIQGFTRTSRRDNLPGKQDHPEQLLSDFEAAPVDARLKPILTYARKLTLQPAMMTQADADAVFAAGWGEAELHDAVLTICLFNFMNRLLEGHGVKGNSALYQARGQALRDEGYAPLLQALPPVVR
jgi:hypothetical protein